ncbi:hypothetical protein BD770DRAFT_395343 [Pilaira anomala]|nr:hypothetical protein BD770DRAFT_395343 [Pilaira anomala]
MGSSISKVSCADISINHKKNYKPVRRPRIRIDKTKIGIPTDFRHTYHVGNGSPLMEEFGDSISMSQSASIVSDKDFMATMAQITDALQKLPLHTPTGYYSPTVTPLTIIKKIGNSASDQQIKSRSAYSLLNNTESKNTLLLETSTSMIVLNKDASDDTMLKIKFLP